MRKNHDEVRAGVSEGEKEREERESRRKAVKQTACLAWYVVECLARDGMFTQS